MFVYKLSNTKELDKHTALEMGGMYRDQATSEWCVRVVGEAAQGRTAKDNVDELQAYLRRCPPQPLAPPRPAMVATAMPTPVPVAMGIPTQQMAGLAVAAPVAAPYR